MKQPVKVMIIEKNWHATSYYQNMITSKEFEICGIADSYGKAIRIAESCPPDVALIDIDLYGSKDGIQTAESLKRQFDIPTLFLTNCSDNKVISEAVKTEALGYLMKPLNIESLIPFFKVSLCSFKTGKKRIQDCKNEIKQQNKKIKAEMQFRKRLENSLKKQTEFLSDANRALKSMLENREVEQRAIEFHFSEKCRKVILPYLDLIEQEVTANRSRIVLDLLKRSLDELITPSFKTLFKMYSTLTHQEVQITDMIRNGKTTKEIAGLLNIAPTSISTYRYRIRKKLGLLKTGKNLQAYLNSDNA